MIFFKKSLISLGVLIGTITIFQSCQDAFLYEEPRSVLSTHEVLKSERGFENYMTALHVAARGELSSSPVVLNHFFPMQAGTDVASFGHPTSTINNYSNF